MLRNNLCSLFRNLNILETQLSNGRTIFTNAPKLREVTNRKEMLKSLPSTDEGTAGEKAIDVDSLISQ